ncbi:MAG: MocR-like transcription factor YczR [Microbacteriaceae bacterium]
MSSLSARTLVSLLSAWREAASVPAYRALADRIRLLVVDGRITLGTKLPAERDLAAQLGISRTTVAAAYSSLRGDGYLTSLRGSGSVARLPTNALTPSLTVPADYLDFSKATSPAVAGLADAAAQAAADLPAYLGFSGFDLIGIPALRAVIAERYRKRGLPTDPEQIMVTIGAQHAIALLARTLLSRGECALVESPSYPHAFEALRLTGARLMPVSVSTADGWDATGLEQVIKRTSPTLGYLMPDFHNPTGRTMEPELRQWLLGLAAGQGTLLIADETTAELNIDHPDQPLPFAAYGEAVSVGSLAKTVWGGLRIGWIRAERPLIQRLLRARPAGDLGTPILDQLTAAHLLADYERILTARRAQLRTGRDHLVKALHDRLPHWQVPDVAGGLTVWVNLGAPVSSQLTLAARTHGLLMAAGPQFGVDGAFERFLRIPFSLPAEQTDRAVDALALAWRSLSQLPLSASDYLAEVV